MYVGHLGIYVKKWVNCRPPTFEGDENGTA